MDEERWIASCEISPSDSKREDSEQPAIPPQQIIRVHRLSHAFRSLSLCALHVSFCHCSSVRRLLDWIKSVDRDHTNTTHFVSNQSLHQRAIHDRYRTRASLSLTSLHPPCACTRMRTLIEFKIHRSGFLQWLRGWLRCDIVVATDETQVTDYRRDARRGS